MVFQFCHLRAVVAAVATLFLLTPLPPILRQIFNAAYYFYSIMMLPMKIGAKMHLLKLSDFWVWLNAGYKWHPTAMWNALSNLFNFCIYLHFLHYWVLIHILTNIILAINSPPLPPPDWNTSSQRRRRRKSPTPLPLSNLKETPPIILTDLI